MNKLVSKLKEVKDAGTDVDAIITGIDDGTMNIESVCLVCVK